MSLQLIHQYHHKVQEIMQYGGSRNETAIRPAFQKLLEHYCADKKIELILELEYRTVQGKSVYPDGTLKDAFRQDWGYWESKDQKDTVWATVPQSSGFSNTTRSANPKTRPSVKNLTPIVLPIIKSRSSSCCKEFVQ